jgi:hypothetical protein
LGYGWFEWRDHKLSDWLKMPASEWLFGVNSLLWEINLGMSMWLAAFLGAPLEEVVDWHKDFLTRAKDEQLNGDFYDMTNNATQHNIPSFDSVVAFFRDILFNRLLEMVP